MAWLAVGGELLAVHVTAMEGKRLRTRGTDGVERIVAPDRLYWVSAQRVSRPEELKDHAAAVRARSEGLDLQGAWELLAESEAFEPESAEEIAALIVGGRSAVEADAAIVAIFGDPLYFKVKRGQIVPTGREAVEATRHRLLEEAREAEQLTRATARLAARLRGEPRPEAQDEADEVAEAHFVRALVDFAVEGKDSPAARKAMQVMEALQVKRTGDPPRRAFELLVKLGEFGEDENLFVRAAAIRTRFPAEVLAEAERLAQAPPMPPRYFDARELLTLAIDDARTTEVDDAFAVVGGRLYVFIADAAAVAPRGGAVDREASMRASTLYLPEGKVPMMPPRLAEDVASLLEGVDRPALCFSGELSADGELVGFEVSEALCRVDRRLTYVQTDAILEGDPTAAEVPADVVALVRQAAEWMERHQAARRARGALLLQRSEFEVRVDPELGVEVTSIDANGPARRLVSEMMIAVCAATATWCRDQQIPCVYRAQAPPDQPIDTEGAGDLDAAGQIAILRTLKPSELTTQAQGHFTLGVGAYTQVTSPIRRYQDLLMHQQIKTWLRTRRPLLSDGQLMAEFSEVDRLARALRRIENDTRRYWTLRYLEKHRDRVWEGTVLRELGRRWLVELDAIGLQTPMVSPGRIAPGDRLQLRVAEVSARRDHLVLHAA
ncbi:MAG: RNB domain-containing ribonuclease [Deltaproteobacteria bacterium]|nr:RNB domain-containing ribonuclease [Deltaproteobacteria bacterium]MCB9787771.1 RNB domain-containing ribonuclease [Deltaproteobacteria bacterium]